MSGHAKGGHGGGHGEEKIRHLIAVCGTAVGVLVYFFGYMSGRLGWWFSIILLGALYYLIYTLVEA